MYFTYTRGVGLDRKEGASFRSDTESVEGEAVGVDLKVRDKILKWTKSVWGGAKF